MIATGVNVQRIARWSSAVLLGPSTPAGGIRLTLHHAAVDEAMRLLRTWDLEGLPEKESLHDLIDEIDREAVEDASQMGWGVQRYVLEARTIDGRPLGSLTLRISANAQTTGELTSYLDSEPATRQGQVAQAMRNTEAAFRLLSAGFGTILEALNRRLGQQDQLVDKMLANQTRTFELQGELSDKRFEREVWADTKRQEAEVRLHKEIAELDRKDMWTKLALERVVPLIPAVLGSLTGKSGAPAPTTPRDEILAGILDTVTEEQFAALQSVLSPSQLASLMVLAEKLQVARNGRQTDAGPGTSSSECKPSDETAMLAIVHIKRDLLPWAIPQLKSSTIAEPPPELAKAVKIFKLFTCALSPEQYKELVVKDDPLDAEERWAFAKLAEQFRLAPAGVASPPRPAKEEKRPGKPTDLASLLEAFSRMKPPFPAGSVPDRSSDKDKGDDGKR